VHNGHMASGPKAKSRTRKPKDARAAQVVLAFLEDKGMSPEAFAMAAFNANCGFVSGRTVRRVVDENHIPDVNHRAVIARYMKRAPRSIWRDAPVVGDRRVKIEVFA
jgi:hypothetical protein